MISEFLSQDQELEAFITGPAGSGKTTKLQEIVQELNEKNVVYRVVAYTHKAKDVLISKLPDGTPISTLHSWLKKRPGINEKAKHIRALVTSNQYGKPQPLQLLIVDEFSFVGEKDYFSIGELQDELLLNFDICSKCHKEIEEPTDLNADGTCDRCGGTIIHESIPPLKVLYVGDLNQLSPVDGMSAVMPHKPFWTKLTTVYRTHNSLQEPLGKLVKMIEGKTKTAYLEPNEDFIRGVDIHKKYMQDDNPDKILLAYTNQRVQELNTLIQGYSEPQEGDIIFNSTMKMELKLIRIENEWHRDCITVNGSIDPNTKFNPLGLLNSLPYVRFYVCDRGVFPGIFGMYNNKLVREELGLNLVNLNKEGKDSRKAFRLYKTVSDYVSILDFNHCVTIHKSQGSEFEHVYVDSKDLSKCLDKTERMKLLYVAISRAKSKAFLSD